MFRFSDFWKISVLAVYLNLMPPIACFAEGPIGSATGSGNDRAYWVANEYGWGKVYERGTRTALPAGQVYFGFQEGGYTPSAESVSWITANFVTTGVSFTGLSALALSYAPGGNVLDNTSLGTISGQPFARWLVANNAIWDADGDGDVDSADLVRIMTDMDGDGLANGSTGEKDTDGDGELDVVEARMEAATGIPHKFNVNSFPDRDGDELPDMNDNDGDGWPNWLESWPKANGMGTISDPLDAESHPAGSSSDIESWYPILVSKNPDYPGTAFQGPNPFGDDDNDGAFNWLELITPTPSDDDTWYPDGNGDGIWDWYVEPGGGGGGSGVIIGEPEDEPDPDPPPPPPPFVPPPTPPTVFTPGNQVGGTITAPSSTNNPNQMYVDNTNSTQSTNIGAGNGAYVDGSGNPINVNLPPGTGSSGTTQGEGDYVVIDVPKGVSTNYQGAGGGTWKQRESPDRGEALEGAAESISEGLEGLRPGFGGSTGNAYGTVAHEMSFTLTLPGLGERSFTIPTLPDPSTWYGATLETIRNLIILVAKVVSSWVCFTKIWQALRQSF